MRTTILSAHHLTVPKGYMASLSGGVNAGQIGEAGAIIWSMRTVLIVGAGGSLAQAQSLRPARDREHPPLDGSFFAKTIALAERDDEMSEYVDRFRAELAEGGLFDDPWAVSSDRSLEQFFADVYYEVVSHRSTTAFDILKYLIRIYMWVLSTTTNWMANRRSEGVLGDLVRREIRWSDPDRLTIITFNQDLVIENIVNRLPGLHGQWCLRSLYGGALLTPVFTSGDQTFPSHEEDCTHNPPIELLKLHGSLNWGLRTSESEPRLGTLFPTRRDKAVYVDDVREAEGDVAKVTTGSGAGRNTWYLWPLVVPPIYDKQRITGMSVLQTQWDRAGDAIREADRLVMIGYSIPDADVLARQMLRRGFVANQSLSAVHCVNPDVGIAAKLRTNLNCSVVHMFLDAEAYLDYAVEPLAAGRLF